MQQPLPLPAELAVDQLDARWSRLEAALPAGGAAAGNAACVFVLRGARHTAPKRWKQGLRQPADLPGSDEPAVAWLAARHVYRVESHVAAGLLAWSRGQRPLLALRHVPSPGQVLALQARGWRCVSLLPDGADSGLQPSTFEFALHDLCHAEHFFDPAHHLAQVGFFAGLDNLVHNDTLLHQLPEADDVWRTDWDHVAADMNGSVLFLYSALRRKAQLFATRAGVQAASVLTPLHEALGLQGALHETALRFSVHRDVPRDQVERDAAALVGHFEAQGAAALASHAGLTPAALLQLVGASSAFGREDAAAPAASAATAARAEA